jgi:hypothetical protein
MAYALHDEIESLRELAVRLESLLSKEREARERAEGALDQLHNARQDRKSPPLGML